MEARWLPCLLLAVCCLCSGSASAIILLNGTLGGSVLFEAYWLMPLEWRFGVYGNDTVVAVVRSAPYCHPEYRERCELSDNRALWLHNLTYADQGQYVLIQKTYDGQRKIENYWLQIQSPLPAAIVLNGSQGGSLYIPQSADRAAAFEWRNEDFGRVASLSLERIAGKSPNQDPYCDSHYRERCVVSDEGSLRLDGLTLGDGGELVFIVGAVPPEPSQIFLYRLRVYRLLKYVSFRLPYGSGPLVSGTNVTLYCYSNYNEYGLTKYLLRDGKNVCNESHVTCDYYLYFRPITEQDSGNYTCTVENPVSSATSDILQITVQAPPTTHLAGNTSGNLFVEEDSVSLYCTTQIANARFLWRRIGWEVREDSRHRITVDPSYANSTLTISPVSRNDDLYFTCEAFNDTVRETSEKLSLSLAWHPDSPSVSCAVESYTTYAMLTCSWTGGQPKANIVQMFNSTVTTGYSTVRNDVTLNNQLQQQELICRGEHLGKESECRVSLEVPRSPSHNGTEVISVMEGEDAAMTVNLTPSSLQANFFWFRLNPDPVPIYTMPRRVKVSSSGSESTFLIPSVTSSETGTYQCRSTNLFGTTDFMFRLQVAPTESSVTPSPPDVLSIGVTASIIVIVVGVVAALALFGLGVFISNTKSPKKSVGKASDVQALLCADNNTTCHQPSGLEEGTPN